MDLEALIPLGTVGGGSITEVIQVQDSESGALYALKIGKSSSGFPSDFARLFLTRESRAHAMVRKSKCPFFQKLLHDGTSSNPQYLILDWVDGKTLRGVMDQNGPLDITEAVALSRQIAQALAALHQTGLAHGDVHPENILRGEDGTDRLIDLGCAHSIDEPLPECEGLLIGSADYWSPEACSSHGFSGPEADIFALGVVLYESLTGYRPWAEGNDLREIIRRRHGDPPKPFPIERTDVPIALRQLIDRMLARRMSQRPKSRMVVSELIRLELGLMSGNAKAA